MIECKFSLELTRNGIQKSIYAKTGEEDGRKAVITLTESGKVFDASAYKLRMFFDDKSYSDKVELVNGCVEFVLPAALTSSAGERLCELKLSKGDRAAIYSPVFRVLVESSIGAAAEEEAKPVGDPIRYQETISSLPEGDSISPDDEIAVYTPENDLTTKRKISLLPFNKKLENEAVLEQIGADDVNELKRLSEGEYASAKDIPTKVSQLTNDEFFVKSTTVESMIDKAIAENSGITEEQEADLTANTAFREILSDNINALDKLTLSTKGDLLFEGKPVKEPVSSATINPQATAAQTVITLLNGSTVLIDGEDFMGLVFVSTESVVRANEADSDFQLAINNLSVPPVYGGPVLLYASIENGYVNCSDKELAVEPGKVYVFYVDESTYEITFKSREGTSVRTMLLNGINFKEGILE